MSDVVVSALYKFVRLEDFESLQPTLLKTLEQNNIRGTLLLALEGINGTVAGSRASIDKLYNWFEQDPRLAGIARKESYDNSIPFYRTKVKLKKEIVTMGVEGIDPRKIVGTYVKPEDWNALISDPDVTVIDTRNKYEIGIGSFEGAINPQTDTFRQFPDYVKNNLDPKKNKKVAMFCTGGIRCEKSTAYLKEQGFSEVYHLEGGILKYLEDIPKDESMWNGECFVFDNRVTVDHDLNKGSYDQCNACRMPIDENDKASEKFQKGVSCPHCYDKTSEQQRRRFNERQKQVQLAKARGEIHIGKDARQITQQRRILKKAIKEKQNSQSA